MFSADILLQDQMHWIIHLLVHKNFNKGKWIVNSPLNEWPMPTATRHEWVDVGNGLREEKWRPDWSYKDMSVSTARRNETHQLTISTRPKDFENATVAKFLLECGDRLGRHDVQERVIKYWDWIHTKADRFTRGGRQWEQERRQMENR